MGLAKSSISGLALAGLTLLAGFGLCSCADDDTPAGQPFTYNGNSWQVADVRGEGRLVIVAVNPRLAGLGTEAAARYAIGNMPEATYRAAANGWLITTGRFCTPGPAEDADPGYQYHYSCWIPA